MVGRKTLQEIFSEKQLHHILKQTAGEDWNLTAYDIKPAAEGLTGFLGDHLRVTLQVTLKESTQKIHLFVKSMPAANEDKAKFIDEGNYFRREMLLFKVFEELGGCDGPHPWRAKAYIYSESLLVMPDLAVDGYSTHPYYETLDLPHLLLTAASVARFHAAFTNYATHKSSNGHTYSFLDENRVVMKDPVFCDSPWLRAAAKLSTNILQTFSTKYNENISNLEGKLIKTYIEACSSFKEYKDTLNVLIHKDLWANNIMYRYENGAPVNSLLIDFQCLRYGPPALDVILLLYLTTSRTFREKHEKEIFLHYYSIFTESIDDLSKRRLEDLNYNKEEFLGWCEKTRAFGMFTAIAIFPYTLMDPVTAQKNFDDPDTFLEYCNVDRSGPVLDYARGCKHYRERQLEVTEEFVERFVLKCDAV